MRRAIVFSVWCVLLVCDRTGLRWHALDAANHTLRSSSSTASKANCAETGHLRDRLRWGPGRKSCPMGETCGNRGGGRPTGGGPRGAHPRHALRRSWHPRIQAREITQILRNLFQHRIFAALLEGQKMSRDLELFPREGRNCFRSRLHWR